DVLGVGEEALAERHQCVLDATTEMLASAGALFATSAAPGFECALGDRLALAAEACLVAEEPKRGEGGVPLFREEALEIGLDPRGAREARVVAHDAERRAVARDAPERSVLRVQVLLREAEGAPLAGAVTEG